MNLVARPIGDNDYNVLDDGEPVSRIRFALERKPQLWVWNVSIPVPVPTW
jgi:hypothetical protein